MTATTETSSARARETGGYVSRIARTAAGLSQQQLADMAGVSRAQLSRIERGEVATSVAGQFCPMCGSHGGRGPTDEANRITQALADYANGRSAGRGSEVLG